MLEKTGMALSHKGVRLIAGGWTFFIAENLVLSENREALVEHLSESGYRNLYGTLSTIATGSIAIGYLRFGRGLGPAIWNPGIAAQAGAFALQTAGLIGFSQLAPAVQLPFAVAPNSPPFDAPHEHPTVGANAAKSSQSAAKPLGLKARCPIDFDHSRKQEGKEVAGMKRITRHPVLWSMALCGLGSAAGTVLATEVCFGVFPAIMAVIGGAHQDIRHRRSGELSPAVGAVTSHVPFGALAAGVQKWVDVEAEMAWTNAAIAFSFGMGLALRRRVVLKRTLGAPGALRASPVKAAGPGTGGSW